MVMAKENSEKYKEEFYAVNAEGIEVSKFNSKTGV
jgi:hypothetical protein